MTDRPDVSFELGSIKAALDNITRTLSENRTADAQYRTGIRAEMAVQSASINAVGSDLALAKKDIADTKKTIDDIKPQVKTLEDRAMMSKGAANFAIAIGKVGHVITAGIGAIIAVLLERWMRGSPH